MKNLTVKKIALGLFLAGYAASSAFALDATTTEAIHGTAPVMKAKKAGAGEHTNTVRIYHSDDTLIGDSEKPKVGDKIVISYTLPDPDGDVDRVDIAKTLKVYVNKTKDTADNMANWQEVTVTATANDSDDEEGTITFPITSDFAGAYNIGYVVLERTAYGLPWYNMWLQVNDIWSDNSPNLSTPDKDNPLTEYPANKVGAKDHGPGDKANGNGPVIDESKFKVGIFVANSDGTPNTAVNYANATSADPAPAYGTKYVAAVWNDSLGSNANSVDGADEIASVNREDYKFTWYLMGTYGGVNADTTALGTATGVTTNKGTGDTIYLGSTTGKHNTLYSTDYKAGAQGFKLKVVAE